MQRGLNRAKMTVLLALWDSQSRKFCMERFGLHMQNPRVRRGVCIICSGVERGAFMDLLLLIVILKVLRSRRIIFHFHLEV